MRMHLEGVKNALPASAPATIIVPIPVAMTAPAFEPIGSVKAVAPVEAVASVEVAVAAMAPENVAKAVTPIPIRSAAIPATITRVVTVNKLFTLLIELPGSPATSLGHYVSGHAENQQHTHCDNAKQVF